jgi:hypothetical protein
VTDSLEVNVLGNQLTDLLLKAFPRLITCIHTSEVVRLQLFFFLVAPALGA